MENIIISIASVIGGLIVGWFLYRIIIEKKLKDTNKKVKEIKEDALSQAKVIKKEAALQAKEDWYNRKSKLESEIEKRKKELRKLEEKYNNRLNKIEDRLSKLDRREQSINDREINLSKKQKALNIREEKLSLLIKEETKKLKEISNLTREQAKEILLKRFEEETKKDAAELRQNMIEHAKLEAGKEAQKILSTAVQRSAVEYVSESCVSVVPLPSDEMKGRIIGREGRNIRAFENITGIEIIVDDTPEAVIVSGFHPIKREIAKRSLEKLITDGRIHPGRIEDIFKKTEKEVEDIIKESGKKTCLDLGLHDLNQNIMDLIGRLKFRTSFGQNILQHSIETAWICGMLAVELGLDQKLARKIGLLHDIGKALDHEIDGTHPQIGADIAKKNDLSPIIVNAIEAHHEDVEPESIYAVLVQAADSISGSRPGARRETLESYLKRLEELEDIANSFDGVHKCYAIQAGREVRIMVEHNRINDAQAQMLASDVAKKIEKDLQFPGQIKVTVIREIRKNAVAK